MDLAGLIERIRAARGEVPFDLLIEDVILVNVYSGRIAPMNIGIKGNRVAAILPERPRLEPGDRARNPAGRASGSSRNTSSSAGSFRRRTDPYWESRWSLGIPLS